MTLVNATDADLARVTELHNEFYLANENIDVDWLRAHMVPGETTLTWFNLNKSDYIGAEHICRLWSFLKEVAGDAEQTMAEYGEPNVNVVGDVAWVDSHVHLQADFGVMGKVSQKARCTEVWQRFENDEWRMVHFHCSEHEPGAWEGGV